MGGGRVAEILSLQSTGVAEVEQTWQEFVPSARIERADKRVRFSWNSITLEGLSVVSYDLTATVRSTVDPSDQLMACRLGARDGWVGNEVRDLHPGMPWLTVDGPTRARWEGTAHVRALVFDRALAEAAARRISGDDRLVLRTITGAPRDRRLAAQWESMFRHVSQSLLLAAEEGPGGGILDGELRRHALITTLSTFDGTFVRALEDTHQRQAAPRTLRRALAFVEGHAHEPITVDDIAVAAGISTRGLQYVFRRALGVTPTEHLRSVRLAAAHAELEAGEAASVGAVAHRWGFSSASRFTKYYRDAYGRSPLHTLRS